MSETNGNGRIAHFEEKLKAAEAKLAAEKIAQAKRKQKVDKKLFALVGREVCQVAERSADFHLMLKQTLGGAVTDAVARRFLEARGCIA